MMTDKTIDRFDKTYVMQITIKHMHETIDFSSRKTFAKFEEFTDDPEKKAEIFQALGELGKLHKLLNEFKENNLHLFNKE